MPHHQQTPCKQQIEPTPTIAPEYTPEATEPEPEVAEDELDADDNDSIEDVNAFLATVVADMNTATRVIAQAWTVHG